MTTSLTLAGSASNQTLVGDHGLIEVVPAAAWGSWTVATWRCGDSNSAGSSRPGIVKSPSGKPDGRFHQAGGYIATGGGVLHERNRRPPWSGRKPARLARTRNSLDFRTAGGGVPEPGNPGRIGMGSGVCGRGWVGSKCRSKRLVGRWGWRGVGSGFRGEGTHEEDCGRRALSPGTVWSGLGVPAEGDGSEGGPGSPGGGDGSGWARRGAWGRGRAPIRRGPSD